MAEKRRRGRPLGGTKQTHPGAVAFGSMLKGERLVARLTQAQLADQVNGLIFNGEQGEKPVDHHNVSDWETGKSFPGLVRGLALQRLFPELTTERILRAWKGTTGQQPCGSFPDVEASFAEFATVAAPEGSARLSDIDDPGIVEPAA